MYQMQRISLVQNAKSSKVFWIVDIAGGYKVQTFMVGELLLTVHISPPIFQNETVVESRLHPRCAAHNE